MGNHSSPQVADNFVPVAPSQAGVILVASGEITLTLAQAQALADSALLKFCILPKECVLVDAWMDTDDADDGAELTVDAGLLDAAGTGIDADETFIAASTAFQAAARVTMKHPAASALWDRQLANRIVVAELTTNPATPKAFTARMTILYRAAEQGD